MNDTLNKQAESKNPEKKTSVWRRYRAAAGLILLCFLTLFIHGVLKWNSKSQKASEKIIRKAAAYQLNKKPGDLTDEDFAKVTKLSIENYDTTELLHKDIELNDITLLTKFVNLQELDLSHISLPEPDIPKWMVILGKLHVIDLYKKYYKSYTEKYFIDLSTLKNLSNLKVIRLYGTAVKDLTPLTELDNLREIYIHANQLTDRKIWKSGRVPETVFINNKEYKLEDGGWPFWNKAKEETDANNVNPLPTIKYSLSEIFGSPLLSVELRIKIEVDKALKQ